ncbi:hypothetical protein EVAR_14991_1 [Eumeta japonica]|uniref:C2H2-type domain-containing protein n=1 Tax=Eumeta variegata TaxID=151549 RepID=A0A4C1X7G7_EUMVA|nr:hypothetical protein EVAR_14991_1 [Eumeta japonica]
MPSRAEVDKQIIMLREEIKKAKPSLSRKIQNAVAQKKHMDVMKRKLEDICHENTKIKKKLSLKDSVGRPNFVSNQPSLLKTIADIALFGSAADDKRRTESIRSVKTLDELTQGLRKIEFDISRSATYLRLIPRKSNSVEGRRHNIASILEQKYLSWSKPAQVFFVSQDDKAQVPIGVTASNKQALLLMHMEYRIKLPDHDWDFETLLELEEFRPLAKTDHGLVEPVVIMTVDGGPDENPRYQKVIGFAIQHFKRHDLNASFIATNAPGRSAYNRVERRMAPLSWELAGLMLPHDRFGSHLDERGVTIDEHLERSNFEFAGNVLAEVWSSMEIDGYNVTAKYVGAGEQDVPDFPDIKWYSEHIIRQQVSSTTCESKTNVQMPYDYFCPTVKLRLSSRTCKTCGLCHASVKLLNRHMEKIHKKINTHSDRKVRPVRVAARRANELMCVIQNVEHLDVEWLNENDVDIPKSDENEQTHNTEQQSKQSNVIENLESWIRV